MTDDRAWEGWPRCPGCGARRQTICPSCGAAGKAVPLAEYQAAGAPLRDSRSTMPDRELDSAAAVWLLCTQCEEAFEPRFYRICPTCGADAGEGLQWPSPAQTYLNERVTLAITGLIAVVTLLLLYFWLLFRTG